MPLNGQQMNFGLDNPYDSNGAMFTIEECNPEWDEECELDAEKRKQFINSGVVVDIEVLEYQIDFGNFNGYPAF